MSDLLRQRPAATPAMIAEFDDAATIAHACAFEVALTRAQAVEGVIPQNVVAAIVAGVSTARIEPADDVALAGMLAIPPVARDALSG